MVREIISAVSSMSVEIKDYTLKAIRGIKLGSEKAIMETAINVAAQAKDLAPVALVNGGLLKGSIMWRTQSQSGGLEEGNALTTAIPKGGAIVGTATEYAVYQEFGTRKMFAQPFLRPAVDIVASGVDLRTAMYKAFFDSVAKELKQA